METAYSANMAGVDLKVARIRARVPQWELAARLGISPPRLSEIEAGRRPITPEMATKIKQALGGDR